MADNQDEKFAPGVIQGLANALPWEFDPAGAAKAVGGALLRNIPGASGVVDTAQVLPKVIGTAMNVERPTPSEMASAMQGRFQQGGFTSEPTPQPKWTDVPMPASAGQPIKQPAKNVAVKQASGGAVSSDALPSMIAQGIADAAAMNKQLTESAKSAKTPYQFEPSAPTEFNVPIGGTGIPGIVQLPDGSYTNVGGNKPGSDAALQEDFNNALSRALLSLRGVPVTADYADMMKNAQAAVTSLAGLKDYFKPQVATTPAGSVTTSVGPGGETKQVADNTAPYIERSKIAADAVTQKQQAAQDKADRAAMAKQIMDIHKGYRKALDEINADTTESPQEAYRKKRELWKSYHQRIGIPENLSDVPGTVEEFIFNQENAYKTAGKTFTPEARAKAAEYYNKQAKPAFDAAYKSVMDRFFPKG